MDPKPLDFKLIQKLFQPGKDRDTLVRLKFNLFQNLWMKEAECSPAACNYLTKALPSQLVRMCLITRSLVYKNILRTCFWLFMISIVQMKNSRYR